MEDLMDLALFIKPEPELGTKEDGELAAEMVIKVETEVEGNTDFIKQENGDHETGGHSSVKETADSQCDVNGNCQDRLIIKTESKAKEDRTYSELRETEVHREVNKSCRRKTLESGSYKLAPCDHVFDKDNSRIIVEQKRMSRNDSLVYFPFKCRLCSELFLKKTLLGQLQELSTDKLETRTSNALCTLVSTSTSEVPVLNNNNVSTSTSQVPALHKNNVISLGDASMPRVPALNNTNKNVISLGDVSMPGLNNTNTNVISLTTKASMPVVPNTNVMATNASMPGVSTLNTAVPPPQTTYADTHLGNNISLATMPPFSKEKANKCEFCGDTFTQKSSLVNHRRLHTGEKPYECDICFKRFTSTNHINDHKKVHTRERNYICQICDKAFSSRGRLRKHWVSHTRREGQAPYYMCEICFKLFTRSTSLRTHLGEHAGGKPFKAKICSFGFGSIQTSRY